MRGFLGVMFITILFLSSIALAHPGKTDRRGGHACRKDCSEWDLYVGEYHLHEEDFRPVKTGGKALPKTAPVPEKNIESAEVKSPEQAPVPVNNLTDTIVEEKRAPPLIQPPMPENQAAATQMIPEQNGLSGNQLWLLLTALGFIVLLAALIARRKKTGDREA
jgi:hypothetical protein